jgi:translation initiation factor IF-3
VLDFLYLKEQNISANEFRVNESIRSAEVRLIGPTGENVGVVATREALRMAREAELDLVEIAPNSTPPVCRITDFGKFLFEREKKDREARKSQTKIEIKEIRLTPKTTGHHRDFKVDDARRWLEHNQKVRVTIRFRGREITYPEIALEDLREIAQSLSDVSTIEQPPAIEGRRMSLMLAPSKGGGKKKTKEDAEKKPEGESSEPPQE